MTTTESTASEPRPQVSLLTVFGFAILQKLKGLVEKNKWMTEQETNEILALAGSALIAVRYFKIDNLVGFSRWSGVMGLLVGSGAGIGG